MTYADPYRPLASRGWVSKSWHLKQSFWNVTHHEVCRSVGKWKSQETSIIAVACIFLMEKVKWRLHGVFLRQTDGFRSWWWSASLREPVRKWAQLLLEQVLQVLLQVPDRRHVSLWKLSWPTCPRITLHQGMKGIWNSRTPLAITIMQDTFSSKKNIQHSSFKEFKGSNRGL